MKNLENMTLAELWKLFPIRLEKHSSRWVVDYREQEKLLRDILPPEAVCAISHIGSTAISRIWAKPIVDILVELNYGTDMEAVRQMLTGNGWRCMSTDANRMSFNLGYTENGFAEKVYHLHLRYAGDNDELYFRDYLNAHPDAADAYGQLKLGLWKQFEHDRDSYTNAKTDFVANYTQAAKLEYAGRYSRTNDKSGGQDHEFQ